MTPLLRAALWALCFCFTFAAASEHAHAQFRLENAFPALPTLDRPVDLQRTPAAGARRETTTARAGAARSGGTGD